MTGMTHLINTDVNIRCLYWTLGANQNDQHVVITSEALNALKSQVCNILGMILHGTY